MSNLKVLIVGSSIAGPTAAYFFAKAGFHVTIIERFASLRTGGQNIDIRTAGVTVMRKIPGMEASVRAIKAPEEGIQIVRADGRPYGTIRPSGNPDQQSLVSEYEIFRGDLAKILVDLTKEHERVKYVFGEQVKVMKHSEKKYGPIAVEFANGFPASEYDLVVACDGATSRTRALGFGCGVRDHVHSVNAWAAYFSLDQDLLEGGKMGQGYSVPGGRMVTLGPGFSGQNRVMLMGIHPRNEHEAMVPFREAMKSGDDATKQYITQHFAGAGWKTDEILKGMIDSQDFYASELVQVKIPNLSKGRFVLVGDAGYAAGPTGGGTSLAIAGAYVLAGEVARNKGDIKAGLVAYEERMTPIIADLQKIPPGVPGLMAPQTAWGIWVRNTLFAIFTRIGIIDFAGRFFSSSFAGDTYGLPEYEWVE
ncbi:oxidoreductase [Clohesyomyces aquaticus]|uniref:Oxidoreductase n=1 Tax=Clohesyomyces aquaticus TaxID=1231657 RepID=A0A1Y1ZIA8_9PLEO|nr:oxidoreductase [Clohesyomyces aquaticus]